MGSLHQPSSFFVPGDQFSIDFPPASSRVLLFDWVIPLPFVLVSILYVFPQSLSCVFVSLSAFDAPSITFSIFRRCGQLFLLLFLHRTLPWVSCALSLGSALALFGFFGWRPTLRRISSRIGRFLCLSGVGLVWFSQSLRSFLLPFRREG